MKKSKLKSKVEKLKLSNARLTRERNSYFNDLVILLHEPDSAKAEKIRSCVEFEYEFKKGFEYVIMFGSPNHEV